METMVALQGYSKKIGKNDVLREINLEVERGSVLWIRGRNGSGKTMLLRAMCGLIIPDRGQVIVDGQRLNSSHRFPKETGVLIENTRFWRGMTALQTLTVLAQINRVIGEEEIRTALARVGLNPDDRKPVHKYSLGMKQKLAVAQAVMEKPKLLLLDEPTNALDSESVEKVQRIIREEQARGATIVIASHISEDIKALCDSTVEMEGGQIRG